MTRVVVVGAGVAGLTTAFRLARADPALELAVFEAGPRPGGRLTEASVGDLELDAGPDALAARKPWAIELCHELGLALEQPRASGTSVWTERGLEALPPTALGIPTGADDLLRWPGLSRRGRLRALRDLVRRPRRPDGDESLGALLRRRLGEEATSVLVAPVLAGLFAGDVELLGLADTFPELGAWERDFGSLIRGAGAAARAGRDAGPMLLRPVGGLSSVPACLAEAIGAARIRVDAPVTELARDGDGSLVRVRDEGYRADAVVLAVPAFEAARLLASVAEPASLALAEIPYVGVGVVLLVFGPGTADALPHAAGFVVPRGRAPMNAATFVSRVWPEAVFGDRAVVRCVVGGAGVEDVLDAPDRDIVQALCRHLAAVLPLPEHPQASRVIRWPRSMPQYGVGHLQRVAAIRRALPPGIVVVGNAYGGVGVGDTVRSADDAAERVRAHLAGEPVGTELVG